jgi:predicted Zn-ribbon and HTH transcriptional regulator
MATTTVIAERHCLRCGKNWFPRKPGRPTTCPKCRSPYWDEPYQRQPKEATPPAPAGDHG